MNTDFDTALAGFIEKVNVKIIADYDSFAPNVRKELLEIGGGQKYIKIKKGGSTYCFVNAENGELYKPKNYASPTKGARGNIFDEHNGTKYAGVYGLAYKTSQGELYHPCGV